MSLAVLTICESALTDRFAIRAIAAVFDISHSHPPSDKVMVVRIGGSGKQFDSAFEQSWPLNYSFYRGFIERSWCYGAESVFIDVAFEHTRGSASGTIERELLELANEIRLIAGDVGTSAAERDTLHAAVCRPEELEPGRAANIMSVTFVQPSGEGARTALLGHEAGTEMQGALVGARVSGANTLMPAPYVLADDSCRAGNGVACSASRNYYDGPFLTEDTVFTPREQRDLDESLGSIEPKCLYGDSGSWYRALLRYALLTSAKSRTPSDTACPPIATIDVNMYLNRMYSEQIGAHTKNKIVVLGAALPMLGDVYDTDAHRELHGFYQVAESINALVTGRETLMVPWSSSVTRCMFLFAFILLFQGLRATQVAYCPIRNEFGDVVARLTIIIIVGFLFWQCTAAQRIDKHAILRDFLFVMLTAGVVLFDPATSFVDFISRLRREAGNEFASGGRHGAGSLKVSVSRHHRRSSADEST